MNKTKIETFDSTWNVVTGCLHGCEYCYARGITNRFDGGKRLKYGTRTVLDEPVVIEDKKSSYPYGFTPTFHRYHLNDYIGRKGRNIFVCSMGDLFGSWVPDSWIDEVFDACDKAPQHNYLFLTKNYRRYGEFTVPRKRNMWYGISISKEFQAESYDFFFSTAYTFASIEPILEDIKPNKHKWLFHSMDWIIIGVETGRRKNKIIPKRKWIEDIVKICKEMNVPVFMKSSLADIWGEPLIQEFPKELKRSNEK